MKKDKNGWILLNLHSKFNQVIRLLKNLANFQEEVVQMAQHFLTATGQQSLKNCPQKTLVYLCQSDKLMTYLGFGRLEEIAVLYKDMILNYLQENQDFKKMFSKLTKNLQSNDIFKNVKYLSGLGHIQIDIAVEFINFFIKELDNLHESKALQNCTSVKEKLQYIEQHLNSKLEGLSKVNEYLEKVKKEENLYDFLKSLIFQDFKPNYRNELEVKDCYKCGYKFNPDVKVVKDDEMDSAFLGKALVTL